MPRDLAWDGCVNIRDLGGFTTPAAATAFGVFVRADNARNLTPAGWRAANEYGIRTVLDLRSDPECAADPPAHPDFTHVRLSLFDHFDGDDAYRSDLLARVANLDVAEKHRTLYRESLDLDAARFAGASASWRKRMAASSSIAWGARIGRACSPHFFSDSLASLSTPSKRTTSAAKRGWPRAHRVATEALRVTFINQVLDETEVRHGTVAAYLLQAGARAEHLERIRRRFVPRDA